MKHHLHTIAFVLALAVFYFCAGAFGLSLALINPSASAIWPAAGIALATLLLWGYRLWPGVFLGAFLVNFLTQGSWATALAIAAGNTLEALLATWLVARFAGGRKAFDQTRNILFFILLAAIVSPSVAATIGVTSLALGGYAMWGNFLPIWLTWWLGDMVGDLMMTPLLALWLTHPFLPIKPVQLLESAGLLLVLLLVGGGLFLTTAPPGVEYFALVPLLWGALRFGRRGAVTASFLMSAIALWGTWHDLGPFANFDLHEALLVLQLFTATLMVTALVVASVVSERRLLEQRLRTKDAISRILAEAGAVKDAAPTVLRVLCETPGWDLGVLWKVERSSGELACIAVWSRPTVDAADFEEVTRQLKFSPGWGIPGRVWSSAEPAWFPDVAKDDNFPRASVAAAPGLRSAVGFPITAGEEVLGVIVCYSREVRQPDHHFLDLVGAIGGQIGQFIERAQAEESLRVKESQIRLIADIAPVMLVQCDRDAHYKFVNQAYAARFNFLPEQIVGKALPEVVGAKAYDIIRSHVERVLGGEAVRYEAAIPYESLGWRHLHIASVPERNTEGDIIGWVSAITDMTERKQAEETLQKARDELAKSKETLEKRVYERTADLEEAKAALLRDIQEHKRLEEQLRQAQKMEIVGTMTGGIAHNFNNILNIIRGYASLLEDSDSDPSALATTLKVIDETIDRGAAIIQQLFAIARKNETRLERVNLNDILQKLSQLLSETLPKTIVIDLNLDTQLPAVIADPNQINQVLLNMSLNARDAMPEGGKLLFTTAIASGFEPDSQFRPAREEQCYAAVTVSDTGSGMTEETKQRIFEPFFSTKRLTHNTGLGLSVADGIIANHGGFIEVASRRDKGTNFRIYLPIDDTKNLSPRDTTEQLQPPSAGEDSLEGEIVLLVEDEMRQAELMRRLLERNGYRVLTALNGVDAVEIHRQHKNEISIVVLDLGLPGLNGWQVLERMKQADPGVKPIVATGYLTREVELAVARGDFNAVIRKPYQLKDMLQTISAATMSGRQPSGRAN